MATLTELNEATANLTLQVTRVEQLVQQGQGVPEIDLDQVKAAIDDAATRLAAIV